MLYTPRIYLTEDQCYDLTITTIINYDFWEVAPVETCDYITAYCPELLDRLAYPIFGVLDGELSVDDAIEHIKTNILIVFKEYTGIDMDWVQLKQFGFRQQGLI